MSVPPPPPPSPHPTGPSSGVAWLIGLGMLIVAGLAVVIVLMVAGNGNGEGTAAPATEQTGGTPATEQTGGTPAPEQPDPGTQPDPDTDPDPDPAADPDPDPAADPDPDQGSGISPNVATLPEVPIGPLLATCLHMTPARALPENAQNHTTMRTDFDQNGSLETFGVYRDPDLNQWFVRVDVDGGYSAEVAVVEPTEHMQTDRIVTFGNDRLAMFRSSFADDPPYYSFYRYRDCLVYPVPVGPEDRLFVGRMLPVISPDIPQLVGGFGCTAQGITRTLARRNESDSAPFTHTVSSQTFTWDPATGGFVPEVEISVAACCDWPEHQDQITGVGVMDCPGGIR